MKRLILLIAIWGCSQSVQVKREEPAVDKYVEYEKAPQMIESAKPIYPELAKKNKIIGKVFVKVLIDENGKPHKAFVTKSDSELLNSAAVDAAMSSKFTPALQKGEPVAVWIVLPYKFNVSQGETNK